MGAVSLHCVLEEILVSSEKVTGPVPFEAASRRDVSINRDPQLAVLPAQGALRVTTRR